MVCSFAYGMCDGVRCACVCIVHACICGVCVCVDVCVYVLFDILGIVRHPLYTNQHACVLWCLGVTVDPFA